MQHKFATALYIAAGLLVLPAVFMHLLGGHLARSVVLWYNPTDGSHRSYEDLFRWTARIVDGMGSDELGVVFRITRFGSLHLVMGRSPLVFATPSLAPPMA